MSLIPLEVLSDLSAHFKTAPGGGLDCSSFVELMLTLLPIHNFDDQGPEANRLLRTLQEVSYAIGIMRLFSDIDINGDQTLEWDELTQYLVDAVLAQSGKDNIDNSEHKPQDAGLDREHLLKMELLETAPKMYRVSPSSQQPVCQKKIVLTEFWDKTIAVLEDLADRIRLFTPNLEMQSEFCAGFRIFAAAVDHQSHLLCCLTSEPSLLFFDLAQQDFPRVYRQRLAVLHSQLFYLPEHKAWGVAQSNSKVLFGELVGQPPLETRRWETLATVHTHSDRLTGLVEASSADWFATSSLDGTIKIWSMIENKLISKINEEEELYGGKHNQTGAAYGVSGIDHSKQDPSFLLSWGFHSQVLVWQPIMSPTHPLVRKYVGHVGIVNSARFLLHSKAAASLDNRGTLKIWDYFTGDTFQSLPLMESNLLRTLSNFVILGLEHSTYPDSIVAGGKHLLKIENPSLSSQMALIKDSQPLSLVYVTHFEGVLILTSSNLKAIRAHDSEVLFSLQLTKKAVSMVEGARGRKVYVAFEDGTIELLNAQNGKLLKTVCHIKEKEPQAIKHAQLTLTKMAATSEDDRAAGAVLYLPDERILVVALHSVIYLFDESDSMDSNLLKFFLGGHDDAPVQALAYSRTNGVLASGSTNGIVSLWMLYLNVHISSFFVKEPVKHLCWLENNLSHSFLIQETQPDGVLCRPV